LKGRFHGFGIIAAAFSPDGSLAATGGRDGTAKIWDVETGKERLYIKGHVESLRAVAFDPNNRFLLTGSADRTARVWDLKNGRDYVELRGHGDSVNAVSIGEDPTRPATGSSDGTAKLWDVYKAAGFEKIEGHRSNLWKVAFSPGGEELLTCSGEGVWGEEESDNTARIWNIRTKEELLNLDGHSSSTGQASGLLPPAPTKPSRSGIGRMGRFSRC